MTIELTWQLFVGGLLAVCGGIVSIGAAVTVIVNFIVKLRSPEKMQNERLDTLEKEVEELKEKQQKNEDISKVTLDALFALLSHGISGNAIEEMTDAQRHLKKYLIDK